jgi:hypothetical protein
VELRYVPTDRQTADIFTKPLGLDKLRQFSGALGLRHLDVPNLRGRNDPSDQGGRKEQVPEEPDTRSVDRADARYEERKKDTRSADRADARVERADAHYEERKKDARSVERADARDLARKTKAEPDEAEPSEEEADDYESRSGSADNSGRGDLSESADERRPKRTDESQRMRQRRDSKKAEKGRRRPGGSKRSVKEMHVRGRLKDHTTDMQSEIRGVANPRSHGKSCDTKIRVFQKARKSVEYGKLCNSEEYDYSCVYGKTEKHEKSYDTNDRVNRRKHEKSCKPTKTRKSVWRLKDAEIPNNRSSTTCSKTSGTRPKYSTSESLNIRKDGEDQRPIQNRILERKSSERRRTSGPERHVRDDDDSADKAQGRRRSKPRAQGPQVELEGEC